MIDRSHVNVCLRRQTLLTAACVSLLIFAFPLVAATTFLIGALGFVLLWMLTILLLIVGCAGPILGVMGLIVGTRMLSEGREQEAGKNAIGGVVALVLGVACLWGFSKGYPTLMGGAEWAWGAGIRSCSFLYGLYVNYQVYYWSWGVLLVALTGAALVLLTVALLRCEAAFKYTVLKIGYACPRCHWRGVPHFRCRGCGTLVEDLRPTVYGVWQARCDACGQELPTTDFAGRVRLDKVCRNPDCSHDLEDETLGLHSEYHLAVVGATSSGKTNLMLTALWKLEEFARDNNLTVSFADAAEEQAFRQAVGLLKVGKVLPKTVAAATPRAFNLSLRPETGRGCLLYLYDAAGEDFEAGEAALGSHTFHRFIDGILFVVDPFAEEGQRRTLSPADARNVNVASSDALEILGRLMPFWERSLRVAAEGRFPIPVAVVVTKMDACGLDRRLDKGPGVAGYFLTMGAAATVAERQSAATREFLCGAGLGGLVGNLEARFARVAYFPASALGRTPDPTNPLPFRPRGVLEPLVWLCHHTGALSDASELSQAWTNLRAYFRRALRGQEGSTAQLTTVGLLVGLGGTLLYGLWWLGGFLLCGLVVALGLLGRPLWLRYRSRLTPRLQNAGRWLVTRAGRGLQAARRHREGLARVVASLVVLGPALGGGYLLHAYGGWPWLLGVAGPLALLLLLAWLRARWLARPVAPAPAPPPPEPAAVEPIRFACTHCGRRLRAGREFVGRRMKCPVCKQVVVVQVGADYPAPARS